jgi:hypothetical protein
MLKTLKEDYLELKLLSSEDKQSESVEVVRQVPKRDPDPFQIHLQKVTFD